MTGMPGMKDHPPMKMAHTSQMGKDGKSMTLLLKKALVPGSYTVKWSAAGADSHRMGSEFSFKVNDMPPPEPSGEVIGPDGFGRLAEFDALERMPALIEQTLANLVSHVVQLGDKPHLDKLIGPVKIQLDAFAEGTASFPAATGESGDDAL